MKKELNNLLDSVVHILDHYEEYGTITDEIMCNLEDSYDAYSMAKAVNDAELITLKKEYNDHYGIVKAHLMEEIEQTVNHIKLQSEDMPSFVISCDPDFAENLNEVMSAQVNDNV